MLHLPPLNGVSSCRLLRVVLMYLSRTCETVSSCSPLSVDNKAYKHKLPTEGRVVYIATMALPIQQHQLTIMTRDHLVMMISTLLSSNQVMFPASCLDKGHTALTYLTAMHVSQNCFPALSFPANLQVWVQAGYPVKGCVSQSGMPMEILLHSRMHQSEKAG